MQVQVHYFGGLYPHIPAHIQNDMRVTIPAGFTLSDLIHQLELPEHAVWLVTLNNRHVPLNTLLAEGNHIEIFAPVAGG